MISTNPAPINFTVDLNVECTDQQVEIWPEEISGSKKLKSKTWIDSHWLTSAAQIGAYTHAWRRKNNGNWVREWAQIKVSISGHFYDNACNYVDHKHAAHENNNDRKIERTRHKGDAKYHMNNNVNSFHRLIEDGITIQFHNYINLCQ